MHDILINNYWLHKWKLTDDDKCRWCGQDTESIYHVFWECHHISVFWKDFNEFCSKHKLQNVDEELAFYGINNELLCCLIFVAKRFVYKCLYDEQIPTMTECLKRIDYVRMIEYNIALKNNKLQQWMLKWRPMFR